MSCYCLNLSFTGRKRERVLSYSYLNNTLSMTKTPPVQIFSVAKDFSRKNAKKRLSKKYEDYEDCRSEMTISDDGDDSTVEAESNRNGKSTPKQQMIAFPDFMNDFAYQAQSIVDTAEKERKLEDIKQDLGDEDDSLFYMFRKESLFPLSTYSSLDSFM